MNTIQLGNSQTLMYTHRTERIKQILKGNSIMIIDNVPACMYVSSRYT